MLPTTQLFELEGKNIQNTRETLLKRVHTQRQPYVAFVRAEPNIRQYTDNRTLPPGTLYVFGQGLQIKTIELYASHALRDGRSGISQLRRRTYLEDRILVCESSISQESGHTSMVRVPKVDLPCGIMDDRKCEQTDRASG